MRTVIEWRRNLGFYLAVCDCGREEAWLKLSEAEHWACTHTCPTLTATVFDITRVAHTDPHVWVGASGPDVNLGWRTTTPPAKGTRITITITEGKP